MTKKTIDSNPPRLVSGLAKVLTDSKAASARPSSQPAEPIKAEWRNRGDQWGPMPGEPWSPWDPSSYAASQVSGLSDQLQGTAQTLSQAMDARQSQVSWLGALFDPAMWSMRRASWAVSSAQSATSSALSDLQGQGGLFAGGQQDAPGKLSEVQGHLVDADQALYNAQLQLSRANPYSGYDDTMYLVGNARQGVEAGYQEAGYAMSLLGAGYSPEPYARSLSAQSTDVRPQGGPGKPTAAAILSEVSPDRR